MAPLELSSAGLAGARQVEGKAAEKSRQIRFSGDASGCAGLQELARSLTAPAAFIDPFFHCSLSSLNFLLPASQVLLKISLMGPFSSVRASDVIFLKDFHCLFLGSYRKVNLKQLAQLATTQTDLEIASEFLALVLLSKDWGRRGSSG